METTETSKQYVTLQNILESRWTRTMVDRLLGAPDKLKSNPHYRSGPPCRLYSVDRVRQAETQPEFAELLNKVNLRRKGKDYSPVFQKKYSSIEAGLQDAAAAIFSLNRYAKHETCTTKHRDEIYSLKNQFVAWLIDRGYLSGWASHRIIQPERQLTCFCVRDGEYGCHRCGYTTVYRTIPERVLEFAVFRFVIGDEIYTWHQPDKTVTFEYKHKAPQLIDNGDWVSEREKPLEMPRTKFAQGKALIRWVMQPEVGSNGL